MVAVLQGIDATLVLLCGIKTVTVLDRTIKKLVDLVLLPAKIAKNGK
jgi:hypothetical protein